jgi:hypothetical protein
MQTFSCFLSMQMFLFRSPKQQDLPSVSLHSPIFHVLRVVISVRNRLATTNRVRVWTEREFGHLNVKIPILKLADASGAPTVIIFLSVINLHLWDFIRNSLIIIIIIGYMKNSGVMLKETCLIFLCTSHITRNNIFCHVVYY